MSDKFQKKPGADHPITIEPHSRRVIVRAGDRLIADSIHALALREAAYPVVLYLPRADVDLAQMQRADLTTHCPYKGDANYYSIPEAGPRGANIAWTYEDPYEAVEAIAGHIAFYPDRVVDIEEVAAESEPSPATS